jgi:hypothetical protein
MSEMDDDYLDYEDDCISSWDDSPARPSDSRNQSYHVQAAGGPQEDTLKHLFKLTKSSKDRKTLKLIESAWESIKKFDATYEKVSRLQFERVLFPGSHAGDMGEDEVDEDEEILEIAGDADSEVDMDLSTTSPTEDSKAFDDDDEPSSSGSDYGEGDEIDPAKQLKQHKKFLLLVAQRTNEFIRAHAGPAPHPAPASSPCSRSRITQGLLSPPPLSQQPAPLPPGIS